MLFFKKNYYTIFISLGYIAISIERLKGRSFGATFANFSSIAGRSSIIFVKNAKNLFQRMLVESRRLLGSVVVNGRDLNFVDQGTGP